MVAPYAGAWIEIFNMVYFDGITDVAPYAGAWIEIRICKLSLVKRLCVAPYAGAWIEICPCTASSEARPRRPLRGGVD